MNGGIKNKSFKNHVRLFQMKNGYLFKSLDNKKHVGILLPCSVLQEVFPPQIQLKLDVSNLETPCLL